jgi:hypothetical protein
MTVEMTGQPEVETPVVEPTQPQIEAEVSTPESEAQPEVKTEKSEPNPVQKRINEITRARHEAERRSNAEFMARQQAEQRVAQLEAERQEWMRRATQPKFEQYNDLERYQQAVEAHSQAQIAEQRKAFQEQAQRQQQNAAQEAFIQRQQRFVAEGAEKYPDFAEVVGNPAIPRLADIHPAVTETVLEEGPAVAYYLAKNPAEIYRLMALSSPASAIKEIGKIAAKLSATPAKPSAAPAPAPTVGGNATVRRDLSDMPYEDYVKARTAARKRR